jgi:uncharacterized membrane protein YdjX (TVP38/TMEM64 family)
MRTRPRLIELTATAASVAAGAVLVLAVPDLRHAVTLAASGDLHGLHRLFQGLGAAGAALLLGLILVHAVVWYPTELVTATAGLAYGFLPGLALALGGWVVSAMLSYALGRTVGEPVARLLFGARRVEAFSQAVIRRGVPPLLAARLVPIVPFSLTGYVAGAVRVPLWRFAWTTVVGYLPLCALVAYLGAESRTLSTGDPRLWLGVGAIVALLVATRGLRRLLVPATTHETPIEATGDPEPTAS